MIMALGESLVDLIDGRAFLGGGPYNTALAAARLGSDSAYVGRISSDAYGRAILDSLVDEVIFFDPALCNAPERTASSRAERRQGGDVAYSFDFDGTAASKLSVREIQAVFELVADLRYLSIGSVSLALEPSGTSIEEAVMALGPETVVYLDANVRTSVVPDVEAYRRRLERLARRADVARFSTEDINALYPGATEKELFGRLGLRNLITTDGAAGACWRTADGVVFQPAFPAEVRDTVGCGDTFNGAVLHCLERLAYHESRKIDASQIGLCLRFASLAASENSKREGCDPPRLEESESLREIEGLL